MSSRPSTPNDTSQHQQRNAMDSRQVARKPVPAPLTSRLLDEPLTTPSLFEFACYFDKTNWPQPPKAVVADVQSPVSQSAVGIGSFISPLFPGVEQIIGAYENPRTPPPVPARRQRTGAERDAWKQARERNLRDPRLHAISTERFSRMGLQDSQLPSIKQEVAPKRVSRANSFSSLTRSWSHEVVSGVRRASKSAVRRLSGRGASESCQGRSKGDNTGGEDRT